MNCDRIARCYRPLEYLVFGRALERRRFEYLGQVGEVRRALILGDGDGRFTAELVRRYPLARVDSVELSSGMLALAQARLRRLKLDSERVRFFQGDVRTIDLEGEYDLIATHFFLDCFAVEELRSLVSRVSERCVSGGHWLVSEFSIPAAGLHRRRGSDSGNASLLSNSHWAEGEPLAGLCSRFGGEWLSNCTSMLGGGRSIGFGTVGADLGGQWQLESSIKGRTGDYFLPAKSVQFNAGPSGASAGCSAICLSEAASRSPHSHSLWRRGMEEDLRRARDVRGA
jgi:SAM-dependent methyltransferase